MKKKSIKKVLAMMISILLMNLLLIEVKVTATNGQVGEEIIIDTDTGIEEEVIPNTDSDIEEETIPNADSDSEEDTITDNDSQTEEGPITDNSDNEEIITMGSKDDFLTTDTFIGNGGKYSIFYILENFNIFSFRDAQSIHIVGPVIAQEKVYYYQPEGQVAIAELTRGISSYVGKLDSTFRVNYGHEPSESPDFKTPNFYTDSDYILNVNVKNGDVYYVNSNNVEVLNPNNSPHGLTKLNNRYIDFASAKTLLTNESLDLLKIPAEDISPDKNTGYLELHVGKNYNIVNADRLRIVNFIYPDGYDPYKNPYPVETIINISGESLATSGTKFSHASDPNEPDSPPLNHMVPWGDEVLPYVANEKCQYFPKTYVNGTEFSGLVESDLGSVDYGSFNNIIWNLPNIKTTETENKLVPYKRISILGHLIAPNAQFYNYGANGTGIEWYGGNIHGTAIVDSWHGGLMEMHLYPYKNLNYGEELPPTGGPGVDNLLLLGLGMMFIALIALKINKLYLK